MTRLTNLARQRKSKHVRDSWSGGRDETRTIHSKGRGGLLSNGSAARCEGVGAIFIGRRVVEVEAMHRTRLNTELEPSASHDHVH
jgi:hypothetical protein